MMDFHAAAADYITAVELEPNDFRSLNAAAWLLSSSPIDGDRDGVRAKKLATKACKLTSYEDRICIDTLASACAELGDFTNALKWQIKARDMFLEEHEVKDGPDAIEVGLQVMEYEDKIALFRSGHPFREGSAADGTK